MSVFDAVSYNGSFGRRFPDGVVFGLVNEYSTVVQINPSPSTFITSGDSLLIIRPNGLPGNKYAPARKPVEVDIGEWSKVDYVRASFDETPMGKDSTFSRALAMTGPPSAAAEYSVFLDSDCQCLLLLFLRVCRQTGENQTHILGGAGKANWKGLKNSNALEGGMQAGMFMLPLEYSHRSSSPEKVVHRILRLNLENNTAATCSEAVATMGFRVI